MTSPKSSRSLRTRFAASFGDFFRRLAPLSVVMTAATAFAAPAATTTTLTISQSTVPYKTPIVLTATVTSNGLPVNLGLVMFCDATATCGNGSALATAQLTASGTAVLKIGSGPLGTHSYKAVYRANNSYASSTSSSVSYTVQGTYASSTSIFLSGSVGNYTLGSTVTGTGSLQVGPTGTVSFIDTSAGNNVIGTQALGAAVLANKFTSAAGSPFAVGNSSTKWRSMVVEAAYLDSDNNLDLVTGDSNQVITVLLGNGDGSFKPKQNYAGCSVGAAVKMLMADFNRDGATDIALACSTGSDTGGSGTTGALAILLGNGDGTFGTPTTYSLGALQGMAMGDFNNDGKLDIVVTDQANGNVTVFLGQGDGTFQAGKIVATPSNTVNDVVVGDFNQDGNDDIAYAVANGSLSDIYIAQGKGDGTFSSPVKVASQVGEYLATGDLDGDGKQDIVSTTISGGASSHIGTWLWVLLGSSPVNKTSTFQTPVGYISDIPSDPHLADVNGDGKPDIIAGGSYGVLVYLNNGDGTFQPFIQPNIGFDWTWAASAGDFNNDGNADLAGTDACPKQGGCAGVGYPRAAVMLSQVNQAADASALTGVAMFPLGSGVHYVEASYPHDARYAASVSSTVAMYAAPAPTTLTLSVSPTSATLGGQPVTLTATLSPYTVSPPTTTTDGESINFYSGSTLIGTGTLSNGVATLVTTSLPYGNDALQAIYPGEPTLPYPNYSPSTSNTITVTVTGVMLASNPNPSTYGQTVTLTATTASGATGTITFMDGSNSLGVVPIASTSTTLATAALTAGSHSLTAVYSGDSTHNSATSPVVTQVVNKAPSTVTVISALNPSTYGQPVTFTATVTSGATGTVTFLDGGSPMGTPVTITGGTASFTTSTLTSGTHTITASYSGDTNYSTATSAQLMQTVNKSAASVALTSSLNPSSTGQPVTFTATVTSGASGAVTFLDGGSPMGAAVTISGGTASFTTSTLSGGTHTITAVYGGDTNYNTATSAPLTQTVKSAATVTLVSSVNPSTIGQAVTFTATVTAGATGTVTFLDGGSPMGAAVTISGGMASFTTSTLSGGTHTITARYSGDTIYGPATSAALTQTVNKNTASVALVSSVNPSMLGQAVTFTATVTSGASGTVTFLDGGSAMGTPVTISGGMASFTISTLSGGTHTITAVYGGDTNYSTATSAALTQTVNKNTASVALTSSLNPSLYGQAVTFTATVTAGATGTVTFLDGGSAMGTPVTISGGTASFTTSTLTSGTHTITASYGGDTSYGTATSAALTQTVNKNAPNVALTSSLNPSEYGQSVTFTAKLAPAATGTVTFADGSTPIGAPVTITNGTATVVTSTLTVGTHTITASYPGDSDYTAGSATLTQTVNKNTPTVTVTTNPPSSNSGQTVTITTTLPPGTTGTVTVTSGGQTLGTGSVDSSGTVTITTSNLPTGTDTITSSYGGDSNNNPATGSTTITVNKNTPTLPPPTVSSTNPAPGTPVTITEQVPPGVSGPVTFSDGGTVLGTAPIVGGTATLTVPSLPIGTHPITASTPGDPNNNPATSPATTVTVAKTASTVTLVSSANPSTPSQAVTFTATVTTGATGSVTFKDGATTLGTGTVNAAGVATFTTSTLTVGTHTITAVYGGDTTYNSATSAPLNQVVQTIATTVTLTQSTSTELLGTSVTFTATVSAPNPTPTGTVSFMEGTSVLGTAPLDSNGNVTVSLSLTGTAGWSTSSLTTGSHTITAVYSGNTNFATSTSAPVTNIVQDFTNTNTGAASQSVMPGGSTTYQFTLAPVGANTFMSDVNLAVDGLPAGTTATFSPAKAAGGSGSTVVTLNLTTSSSLQARNDRTPATPHRDAPVALAVLGLAGLGAARRYRHRMPRMLMMLLLLAGSLLPVAALSGCAGGYFGFKPTTYTVTVTGAEGSIQHAATATLVVE